MCTVLQHFNVMFSYMFQWWLMVKTSMSHYAGEAGNEAYRACWKCHLMKCISPFQMLSLAVLYFKLNIMQNRYKRLHYLLIFKGKRKMSSVYKVKTRVSIVLLRQNGAKQAKQGTVTDKVHHLLVIILCDFQIVLQKRICLFHCFMASFLHVCVCVH
jgi:hypothetical protein